MLLPQQRNHQAGPNNQEHRNSVDLKGWFPGFGGFSKSGVRVNHQSALSLSAVFNAVDQISNDIAKLPKGVYRREGDDRLRDRDHPADYLISKRPSPLMSQFSFHKALILAALLRGNGIAVQQYHPGTGRLEALNFVPPDDVYNIKKVKGSLFYVIKGYNRPLSLEEVIHIPGFSFNGITGVSIFRYAAENMGAAINAELFANEIYKNKGFGYGVLETDKSVKPDVKKLLSDAFESRLSQSGKHFRAPVLDEGFSYKNIAINPVEASLIDWKKVSIEDVARWFNIAPHKIKHLERATYSNIEQQSLEHGSDTIAPWAKKVEEECDYKLFSPQERATHYVKLNTNALHRTDLKARGEYYSRAVNFGWHNRNEIRQLEDYNKAEGLDEFLTPANTLTPEQIDNTLNDGKENGS